MAVTQCASVSGTTHDTYMDIHMTHTRCLLCWQVSRSSNQVVGHGKEHRGGYKKHTQEAGDAAAAADGCDRNVSNMCKTNKQTYLSFQPQLHRPPSASMASVLRLPPTRGQLPKHRLCCRQAAREQTESVYTGHTHEVRTCMPGHRLAAADAHHRAKLLCSPFPSASHLLAATHQPPTLTP